MENLIRVGVDTSKSVFQLHGKASCDRFAVGGEPAFRLSHKLA
ncbi:hypothetical protein [Mesorhizobium sp. M0633]